MSAVLHLGRIHHAVEHRHVDAETLGEAGAAVIEADVADLVVGADRLGDAELVDALAGHHAGLVFALAEIEQAAEFLGQLAAAGIDDDHRDARGDRVLHRFAEGRRIGDGDDEAVRLRGGRRVDHLRHLGHVEGFGRQILGLHAERLGGIVHAVLDDRPVGIAALAVGHEHNAGFIGGSKAGGRRQQCQPGQQAEHGFHYFRKREHVSSCCVSPPAVIAASGPVASSVSRLRFRTGSFCRRKFRPDQFSTVKPASVARRDRFLKPIVA